MITKWNFQTPTEEELHKRDRLASQLGLSPVVCLLLVQRGLTTVEEVKKFFKPSLNDLHDPFLMPDMEKAVKRLNKALGNKEKILIYGDYDVDGTTAVSLVYKYLRPYSSALDYYIPDRYDEGYGISYKGINYARENGITLVISLDCGIKAIEKIEYAKQLLLSTDYTVDRISGFLFFSGSRHFYKVFRETVGMAPTEWRKKNLKKQGQ